MKALLLASCLAGFSCASMAGDTIPSGNLHGECHAKPLFHCRTGKGGTPLVFVHGWGGSADYWKHQLDHFSKHQTVIVVELPGHGRSIPTTAKPTIADLAKSLGQLLEQLDLSHVVMVGHDMGAFIAIATTATKPGKQRISALIAVESLIDTKVAVPKKQYRHIRKKLGRNFDRTARQIISDLFSVQTNPALVRWVSDMAVNTGHTFVMALLDDFIATDLTVEFAAFHGRVVILNSQLNPPKLQKLHRYNPNVTSIDVPWDGHFAFIEQPALFNRTLQRVLDRLPDTPR